MEEVKELLVQSRIHTTDLAGQITFVDNGIWEFLYLSTEKEDK